MSTVTLKYKKTREDAIAPSFANPTDVGFDICTPEDFILCVGKIHIASTGLAFDIPDEYELQIRPKSGLATKGVTVVNSPGTIDPLYKKEVKVILTNCGPNDIQFFKGNKICQGVLKERIFVNFEDVQEIEDLGRGGFGSTGI